MFLASQRVVFVSGRQRDGYYPYGDLVFNQQGNIYGTTSMGGIFGCGDHLMPGCGTIYVLTLDPSRVWTENVLYAFQANGPQDAKYPGSGVIFDDAGNLYGTAGGGANGYGAVYKLTISGSDWTESLLYSFTNGSDGANPEAGSLTDRGICMAPQLKLV